jgi:ABC-type Na+ efflux pump permease subunit
MRVLSVAERELRAAARHKGLFHLRWSAAAAALGFLLWLGWASDVFQNKNNGPEVFRIFSVALFFYSLFVGAAATADGISRERREGTLGLLFLTNLNSTEIVAGKLCAHGLALLYSLVAIFPVLALPLMIGGITPAEFARVLLALLNGLFCAMAIGFAVSSVCVRQFPAVALATGLTLFLGAGWLVLAEGLRELSVPRSVTDWIATFCPLHTLFAATETRRLTGPTQFWFSFSTVAALSWTLLLLTAWRLNRSWRDRPKRLSRWSVAALREKLSPRGGVAREALRRRLLEINPFFWLAGRQRISAPIFMLLVIVLTLFTVGITAPQFERMLRGSAASPVFGQMFAWLWTGLLIHALVLYYAAHIASQRLAEDKQSGALELILSAPGTESRMARGLWLAYGRRMFFPTLIAVLVHFYFIWLILTMMVVDPPGRLPPGATAGEILWSAPSCRLRHKRLASCSANMLREHLQYAPFETQRNTACGRPFRQISDYQAGGVASACQGTQDL